MTKQRTHSFRFMFFSDSTRPIRAVVITQDMRRSRRIVTGMWKIQVSGDPLGAARAAGCSVIIRPKALRC